MFIHNYVQIVCMYVCNILRTIYCYDKLMTSLREGGGGGGGGGLFWNKSHTLA